MQFLKPIYWQEFQQKYGRKVSRFGDQIIIYFPLKKGLSWGLVPAFEEKDQTKIKTIIQDAQENGAIFLKLEPTENFDWEKIKYKIVSSKNVHPQQTLVLDLTKSEDELLNSMKQKTRYNIRLASKKGIEIIKNPDQGVEIFYQQVKETEMRDKAKFHSLKYYQAMYAVLHNQYHRLDVYLAKFENNYLAGAIVYHDFENKISYYLHGASSDQQKNLMAPYLLQWQMIKDCREVKQKKYDFFGVKTASDDELLADEKHSWYGITKFKLGFAPEGKLINYPKARDLILKPFWYKIYTVYQKIR